MCAIGLVGVLSLTEKRHVQPLIQFVRLVLDIVSAMTSSP